MANIARDLTWAEIIQRANILSSVRVVKIFTCSRDYAGQCIRTGTSDTSV